MHKIFKFKQYSPVLFKPKASLKRPLVTNILKTSYKESLIARLDQYFNNLLTGNDWLGLEPIHYAVNKNDIETVKKLLKQGASINSQTYQGSTPLHLAARNGYLGLVNYLLDNGARIDDVDNILGYTALHCAIEYNHVEVAKLLADRGAPLHNRGNDWKTPIELAGQKSYYDLASYLQRKSTEKNLAGISIQVPITHVELARRKLISDILRNSNHVRYCINNAESAILQREMEENNFSEQPVTLVTNAQGQLVLETISQQSAEQADIIISLGLDTADNKKGLAVGIKAFQTLLLKLQNPEFQAKFSQATLFAYSPHPNRVKRYQSGLEYYLDQNYFDIYGLKFAEKYLMPRVLSSSNLIAPQNVKPLLLCGYSLGARENAMYLNAFRYYLSRYFKLTEEVIEDYLARILKLDIGSPIQWESSAGHNTPNSINYLSLTDMGIKKPMSLMNSVYCNHEIASNEHTLLHRPLSKTIAGEFLVTLQNTPGSFIERGTDRKRINYLGHSIYHYILAIEKSPSIQYLRLVESFLLENGNYNNIKQEMLEQSMAFDSNRRPNLSEYRMRMRAWASYLANEGITIGEMEALDRGHKIEDEIFIDENYESIQMRK